MIRNFGSKLKTPRKSHYKKDEVAFDTFKKTS
jgi:transposase